MNSEELRKVISGFSIHCHHDVLVEYCYDYDERVQYIKKCKPQEEHKVRLRLFKILPAKAVKDVPLYWQEADAKRREAYAKWQEADAKWQEADVKWQEADVKWQEADAKRQEADAKRREAYAKWPQKNKDAFHKKWCGCKEWQNGEIKFDK